MNYDQTLEYLYGQLPMFTRVGASAYKKDLTNTIALCNLLNNPQQQFKSIHVAGTNGKGSTSHMLASILQEAGFKVGLYTSPHLKDFRERIRINGIPIPEDFVVDFVNEYRPHFDRIQPSFFEWTVALCFHFFAKQKVDFAIIETGLGGRLDSTNIITPILSVVTNIGWDHMDMLGNTLPLIAIEKAGIIKPHIPIVIGEYDVETAPTFLQRAEEEKSNITFAKDCINVLNFHSNGLISTIEIHNTITNNKEEYTCDLAGNYQQHNIVTVLAAINQLIQQHIKIPRSAISNGLNHVKANTSLAGRWQVLQTQPLIICDTGHNINGIKFVIHQLYQTQHHHLHMVIGMVKDKDIDKILSLLPNQATYYFCNANIPRALPSQELQSLALQYGLVGHSYATVQQALAAAKSNALLNDLIFIGGSTFVVAEVV
jgi:dihydrofolate synthase / folylpolyglutamate synthase